MYPLPPQVNTALNRLNAAGFEAFVVGGAVRDLLRGALVHDWDLTTSALPEETKEVFSDCRLVETGIKHGTVTVLLEGLPLEITTYRVEGTYSDHRRPDRVEFTRSLEEDLARRDFTVNAMAYHPDVGVVDPFGGQTDLKNRVIRCVGDPDKRFQEDALRILRGLRFSSRLGFSMEEKTSAAIRRNRALLSGVAAERLREELTGLLTGCMAEFVLREYAHVLTVPLPELAPMVGFDQHTVYHCHDVWGHSAAAVAAMPEDPVLRWAALLHDGGKPASFSLAGEGRGHFHGHAAKSGETARAVTARLRFDHAAREEILFLVEQHHLFSDFSEAPIRRAIQQFGLDRLRRLKWMFRADVLAKSPRCLFQLASVETLYGLVETMAARQGRVTPKDLAVKGEDLLALGYEGPALGQALERLVHAVAFQDLKNEKDVLLSYLAERP